MTQKFIKVKCEKIKSGEHAGWWCATVVGMGVYAPTKEGARRQLANVMLCSNAKS